MQRDILGPKRYVFPARAGMIRTSENTLENGSSIPRESGDDPNLSQIVAWATEYSPRERG